MQADHRRNYVRSRAPDDVSAELRQRLRPRLTTWTDPDGTERKLTYGDVFHQNEVEQSVYNFEASDCEKLLKQFDYFESEAKRLMDLNLALPAYEMVLKPATPQSA